MLSEVARRRIAALLLIAAIAVAALAITDTWPFNDPPTEEERVAEVVDGFYAAADAGDFGVYCSLLTPAAREQVRANAARLIEEAGQLKCDQILAVARDQFKGVGIRIREVSVNGPQARVEANVKFAGTPGVEARTMFLEQNDAGEWRISDPG